MPNSSHSQKDPEGASDSLSTGSLTISNTNASGLTHSLDCLQGAYPTLSATQRTSALILRLWYLSSIITSQYTRLSDLGTLWKFS